MALEQYYRTVGGSDGSDRSDGSVGSLIRSFALSLFRPSSVAPRALWLILALALILRVLAALYLGNTVSGLSGAADEITYDVLGQRFATGYGMTFPTPWYPWIAADAPQSYFSYTMSLFLATIYAVFGHYPVIARLITALLSTIIVLLVFLVSRRLFAERVALLSAAIAACYAYLIFYGVTLVTETPFMLALMLSFYVALRLVERPGKLLFVVLGLSLASAVLLRMAIVFYVPFLLLWVGLKLKQRNQVRLLVIPVLIIVLALIPFVVRNYQLWGRFMVLESQFGHVFWNGNHPGHAGDFHPFKVFPIPPEVLASRNDAEITSQLLRMGVQNVLRDPPHFLALTFTRLRELFTFWPTRDSLLLANLLRVVSFGAIVPFTLVGFIVNLRRFRSLAPVYLFILIHTGVYAVTWTMVRYRLPLDLFFIMFAAFTLSAAYDLLRRRARKRLVLQDKLATGP